jgi:hypothetical protein
MFIQLVIFGRGQSGASYSAVAAGNGSQGLAHSGHALYHCAISQVLICAFFDYIIYSYLIFY